MSINDITTTKRYGAMPFPRSPEFFLDIIKAKIPGVHFEITIYNIDAVQGQQQIEYYEVLGKYTNGFVFAFRIRRLFDNPAVIEVTFFHRISIFPRTIDCCFGNGVIDQLIHILKIDRLTIDAKWGDLSGGLRRLREDLNGRQRKDLLDKLRMDYFCGSPFFWDDYTKVVQVFEPPCSFSSQLVPAVQTGVATPVNAAPVNPLSCVDQIITLTRVITDVSSKNSQLLTQLEQEKQTNQQLSSRVTTLESQAIHNQQCYTQVSNQLRQANEQLQQQSAMHNAQLQEANAQFQQQATYIEQLQQQLFAATTQLRDNKQGATIIDQATQLSQLRSEVVAKDKQIYNYQEDIKKWYNWYASRFPTEPVNLQ